MSDGSEAHPRDEVQLRCKPGVPCEEYTATMRGSARLRAVGDDDAARHLITTARFHRLVAIHPELDGLDGIDRR
jgi:hypothetical protein